MDMEIQIIELPEVAIIGKEGLCTEENNIAQDLWQEANSHFDEVAALGMRNSDGTYVGFWGAMKTELFNHGQITSQGDYTLRD